MYILFKYSKDILFQKCCEPSQTIQLEINNHSHKKNQDKRFGTHTLLPDFQRDVFGQIKETKRELRGGGQSKCASLHSSSSRRKINSYNNTKKEKPEKAVAKRILECIAHCSLGKDKCSAHCALTRHSSFPKVNKAIYTFTILKTGYMHQVYI